MKFKQLKHQIPELIILASVMYYWLASSLTNPVAIGLLCILIIQIRWQRTTLGLLISTIFILLNLYMVLALMSELSEFEEVNKGFYVMLSFGGLYLALNITIGFLMLIKYLKKANATTKQQSLS